MKVKLDKEGNPLLEQFSEDGFIDCIFLIRNLIEKENSYLFNIVASYKGQEIGMKVEIIKGINSGFDENMNLIQDRVYKQGVSFFRTGTESDLLISVLATLYGFEVKNRLMVDKESFTAIALHQGEIDIRNDHIKLKLFGKDQETNDEEEYNESFFNIDLSNDLVFLNEKDTDYRKAIIEGLLE